jgi:hypothetical protein
MHLPNALGALRMVLASAFCVTQILLGKLISLGERIGWPVA